MWGERKREGETSKVRRKPSDGIQGSIDLYILRNEMSSLSSSVLSALGYCRRLVNKTMMGKLVGLYQRRPPVGNLKVPPKTGT